MTAPVSAEAQVLMLATDMAENVSLRVAVAREVLSLRAEVEALRKKLPGPGEVVVPREPTEHMVIAGFAERIATLEEALRELAMREELYRAAHDLHGDDSREAGYAWDQMRHAGDAARSALAAIRGLE